MIKECPSSDLLSEFTSGMLAEAEHQQVDAHLETCVPCQRSLTTFDNHSPVWFSPSGDSVESVYDDELDSLIAAVTEITVAGARGAADLAGEQVGPYRLIEKIGVGGMGEVYLARHETMQREAAVKFLSPELVRSQTARQRFQREIEVAARLSHPGIVGAYDAGDSDGRFYLVLEYAPGRNLQQVVESSGPIDIADALRSVRQAAEGLAYAHAQNVIHRDVKPSNLMMGEAGSVKVLDLGLASANWEVSELTVSHAMMGTAAFMAPEQAANPRAAKGQADIYALGATLYYLLTGHAPFQADSVVDMAIAHRTTPFPKLPKSIAESKAIDSLLERMVAKQPADRFESMEQVVVAIDERLAHLASVPVNGSEADSASRPWLIGVASLAAVVALLLAVAQWGPWGANLSEARVDVEVIPPLIAMQRIEPGQFVMGATKGEEMAAKSETPAHMVRFVKPFLIGIHEVTQAEFADAFANDDSGFNKLDKDETEPSETLPITSVSWIEAIRFCNALSQQQGIEPYYEISEGTVAVRGGVGYRLPTEAEWEYACRAGTTTRFHSGDDVAGLQQVAWLADNALGQVKPVGTREPNAWGLHDMHGNAPEWVWDRFDPDYYARSPAINPTGSGQGERRVFRGGSVNDTPSGLRSSARRVLGITYGSLDQVGLRVARNVEP